MNSDDLCIEVLTSLRRIIRAVDLQSRQLVRSHGLTGPQAYILKTLLQMGETTIGQLADRVSLSKPTVTDIVGRLEKQQLVVRLRSTTDKRCVLVKVTERGRTILVSSPPLLQEAFAQQFNRLQHWEQHQLISSLHRIAHMMQARDLDAAPILSSGPLSAPDNIPGINSSAPGKQSSQNSRATTAKV